MTACWSWLDRFCTSNADIELCHTIPASTDTPTLLLVCQAHSHVIALRWLYLVPSPQISFIWTELTGKSPLGQGSIHITLQQNSPLRVTCTLWMECHVNFQTYLVMAAMKNSHPYKNNAVPYLTWLLVCLWLYWDWFFPQELQFSLSLPFHWCSILTLHSSTTDVI